jgi:acetyl-CoA carboxylase carboxyl transferase subunit beta
MTLKDWFANRQPRHAVRGATYKRDIPDGLWIKCEHCDAALFAKELSGNLMVCPRCDFHFRVGAIERISQLADAGSFKALDESLRSSDPLGFVDTKPYRFGGHEFLLHGWLDGRCGGRENHAPDRNGP